MLGIDRSEQVLDGEVLTDAAPPCVDLVPVTPTLNWSTKCPLPHPDPSFLTQLIATAAQDPQTRTLRRASLAEAQTAYAASPCERRGIARRTRQVV
jgi:hypothetical protein